VSKAFLNNGTRRLKIWKKADKIGRKVQPFHLIGWGVAAHRNEEKDLISSISQLAMNRDSTRSKVRKRIMLDLGFGKKTNA